jgi:hypothetical protein
MGWSGSTALPPNAATATNQTTANSSLSTIEASVQAIDDPVTTIGTTPLMRVAIFDANNTQVATFPISAASLPLPTGAATSANQTTANSALSAIQTAAEKIDDPVATISSTPLMRVAIFDANDTQLTTFPISAASLPLPTGASTSANQSTANTALSAIQTSVQTIDDPVATINSTPLMRVAIFDANNTQITTFPISASSLPLPTGASTSANQSTANTALSAIQTSVQTIDDPVATISATKVMRVAVYNASDTQVTSFGSTNAPIAGYGVYSAGITAGQMHSGSQAASWVIIQNWDKAYIVVGTDSSIVYGAIGGTTSRGIVVLPKGQSITIPISNLNQIYIIASATTTQVNYIYG